MCIVTHLFKDPAFWVWDCEPVQVRGCVTRNPTSWTNMRSVCVCVGKHTPGSQCVKAG